MRIKIQLILLYSIIVGLNNAIAQSSLNYAATTISTGTLAVDNFGNPINFTTEPNLVLNSSSNVISALHPIGFDFIFMGRYYSHFVAGSNGDVGLGLYNSPSNILGAPDFNDLTRTVIYPPSSNNAPVLAVFWDRMTTPSGSGPTVRTMITGTAPNRCKVIEWNTIINSLNPVPTPSAMFQMRLYEGSGKIEYVYGKMSIVSSSTTVTASIGFTAGLNDGQFIALQNLNSYPFTVIAAQEPSTQSLVNTATPGDITGLHSTADGQRRVFTFTPPALTGTAPTGLQVMEVGATNVALKWDDNYSNELGYNILVSSDNINFISAGTTGPNATFFTVGNLTLGNTYYFKVIAFTEGACSVSSNTVNATTSCFLNGTYSIGPGGTYATLAKAIDSIKVKGVAGNVIFELTGSYTSGGEVFPITFPKISQIPCFNNFNITVRPAVSATNLQIIAPVNGPMLLLDGVNNYVTIDGRPGGIGTTGQLSFINSDMTPVLRLTNSSNNKFLYVKFRGGNYSTGIPGHEGVVLIQGSQGVGSDNNKFAFCDIYGDPNASTKPILLYSSAVSGSENNNDSLINCNFYDFYNSAVNLVDYNDGWVIQSNSFYNTIVILSNPNTAILKIDANFTVTPHQVTQNYFGGTAPNCQGNVMDAGYAQTYYCLDIKGKANVSNNYFRRMRFYNLNAYNNSVVCLLLIRNNFNSEPYVIENNQFGWSSDIADSLHFSHNFIPGQQGPVETEIACLTMTGVGPVRNNQFANIRCYSPYNHLWLKMINGYSDCNIRFNTIGNPAIPDNIINKSNGISTGIYLVGNSANVIGNTICRMTSDNLATITGINVATQFVDSIAYNTIFHLRNGNGGANNSQTLIGMRINPGSSNGPSHLIEGNHVYSLVQESTSGGGNVTGIWVGVSMKLRRNFVHNLYTTNTSGTVTITGILMSDNKGILENNMVSLGSDSLGNSIISGGVIIIGINGADNMRHNSVYIGGDNVENGVTGSLCFSSTVNPTLSYNNIFFNARSNANTTSSARNACVNVGVSYIADYNLYFFTGTGGVLGVRSGIPYTTLAAWQAASGVDPNSLFTNPLFIAPGGTSNNIDLHLNLGSPADAAGTSTNTLVTDFDEETRSTLTPVDIGADAFSIAPQISSFTPTSAASGATVTISGVNFTGATAVSFGGTPAGFFNVVSATTITAVVGNGSSGSVSVTTPNGTASKAGFIFIPAPVITSFTPVSGGTGTIVTITGTNFSGASAVSFGGTSAASYTVVNATTITAVVSSGTTGSVNVTTPGGTASLAGFTFVPAPTITSFTPTSGGAGTTITINGTNFTGTTVVSFGGTAATTFTIVNATTITAVIGAGATGAVTVTTPGGTATLGGFTFYPPPSISSFTPVTGGTGSIITITGTNFTGATAVSFGGTPSTSFTVVNVTTITAVIGSGTTGAVSVTTPGGTGILSGFTYSPVTAIGGSGSVNSPELTVSPNPGSAVIFLKHPPSPAFQATIKISDVLGRPVSESMPARNSTITQVNVSRLSSGVYYIRWKAGHKILTRIFLKI